MIDIDKIMNDYKKVCKENEEYPVAMLTLGEIKGEEAIKQNIYFNGEFSVDDIIGILQEAIIQLTTRQDDARKN